MIKKRLLNLKRGLFSSVLFSLLLAGSTFTNAVAQTTVQIGTETGANVSLPITTYYGYSYSQQIYTAAAMQAAGVTGPTTITKVRFSYVSGNTNNSSDWTVLMGNNAKSSYTSYTDWVLSADLSVNFSGTVSFPFPGGWLEIVLTTPFQWVWKWKYRMESFFHRC